MREIRKFNPDLIVSDFEPAGITAAKLLGKKCIVIFGYNPELLKEYTKTNKLSKKCWFEARYFESLYDKADFVIIPTLLGLKRQEILYHYVNPVIRKEPADLASNKTIMTRLKLKKEPIVVMLGGSDFGLKLAKGISKIAHKLNEQFIVFGSHKQLPASKNFKHKRFAPDFLDYLKVSKAVITLGGQKMLSECLAFKKPMLVFPIQDHVEQLMNAYSLRSVAVVGNKSTGSGLEKEVRLFIKNIPKLKEKMDSLDLNFNGAEQIAQVLIDLSSSKRSAKK